MSAVFPILRVVRTVRRAESLGRAGGTAATGGREPDPMSTSIQLLSLAGFAYMQPELLALILPLIAYSAYEAYITGSPDDQKKRALEQVYGPREGDQIFQTEWSTRRIEIDLRSKAA